MSGHESRKFVEFVVVRVAAVRPLENITSPCIDRISLFRYENTSKRRTPAGATKKLASGNCFSVRANRLCPITVVDFPPEIGYKYKRIFVNNRGCTPRSCVVYEMFRKRANGRGRNGERTKTFRKIKRDINHLV